MGQATCKRILLLLVPLPLPLAAAVVMQLWNACNEIYCCEVEAVCFWKVTRVEPAVGAVYKAQVNEELEDG